MNRELVESSNASSGIGVRGKNASALLESIDSRNMAKNLYATH